MKKKFNDDNIFRKIILREVPAKIIFQDELVTVFEDIKPAVPVHVLIVSNKNIKSMNYVNSKDKMLLGHMLYISKKVAIDLNISKNGYRLIINCEKHGGQEVPHLHIHLLGGKKLGKMLN